MEKSLSKKSKAILILWSLVLCGMIIFVPISLSRQIGFSTVVVQDVYNYSLLFNQPNNVGVELYLINYKVLLMQIAGWTALMFSLFYVSKD